jgi:thioredoxin-related protein
MKKSTVFILLLLNATLLFAQEHKNDPKGIQWMSFKEALQKSATNPKKIYMDIYTGWCGWCKKMDASTFTDPAVIKFMNDNYYAVKLDAETKDTIVYKDKKYAFVPAYKANEIAAYLLNGQMGYPTSVYLDEHQNPITAVPGYNSPEQLLPILKYFAGDFYKTKKFEDFQKDGNK